MEQPLAKHTARTHDHASKQLTEVMMPTLSFSLPLKLLILSCCTRCTMYSTSASLRQLPSASCT
eukprot:21041-Heterococcus_DN1.PRE.1